jgi:hypothetical protein
MMLGFDLSNPLIPSTQLFFKLSSYETIVHLSQELFIPSRSGMAELRKEENKKIPTTSFYEIAGKLMKN